MPVVWLFSFTAALEALTGVALIATPDMASHLLLAQDLTAPGAAMTRLAGVALLSLGVGFWAGRREAGNGPAMASMLAYNVLATLYLAYLAVAGPQSGPLLWPAVVLHAVLSALFARAALSRPH